LGKCPWVGGDSKVKRRIDEKVVAEHPVRVDGDVVSFHSSLCSDGTNRVALGSAVADIAKLP